MHIDCSQCKIKDKMRSIFTIILIAISNLLFAQYHANDTIIDIGINKIKIDGNFLYYSTINGEFHIYDINNKSITSSLNTFQRVNDIGYDTANIVIITGSDLVVIPKDNYFDKLIIRKENQLNTLAISNSKIFFGGNSGKLYIYDTNTKTNKELFSNSDSLYTYWITDIEIDYASNLLFFCAGDFFVYSLAENKIVFKDTNHLKSYTTCTSNGKEILVSDIKNNNIVSFTIYDNFKKEILIPKFSYLLSFITDSIILMSENKTTYLYNTKNKSVVHIFSDTLSAISNDIAENIIGINYINKILIYEKNINFIDKSQILYNLNFIAGETIFQNKSIAANTLDLVRGKYLLQENEIAFVKITGHTDYGGNIDSLKKLSENRAKKIQNELNLRNIPNYKTISYGVGDKDTISKKSSERWKNRRVEVEFITYNSLVQKIYNTKNLNTNKILVITKPVLLLIDTTFTKADCFNCDINILKEENNLFYFSMLVWFAGTFDGIKYATYDNNTINIIRDVNIRTMPYNSDENLGGHKLLKKNSKHEFIEQRYDDNGNLWYCTRLFGITK
jgi:hypothetical protein